MTASHQFGIEVRKTKTRGFAVFATVDLNPNTVIERAPVLDISSDETRVAQTTILGHRLFEDSETKNAMLPYGNAMIYNHSFYPNTDYERDGDWYTFKTLKAVKAGTELVIDYYADWEWYSNFCFKEMIDFLTNKKGIMKDAHTKYFNAYIDGKKYEDTYRQDIDMKYIWSVLKKNKLTPTSLLDVGCATGHVMRDFQKKGVKYVTGIEKYHIDSNRIPTEVRAHWINADAMDVDKLFTENAFDMAFMNILMYFKPKDMKKLLKKVHKVADTMWVNYLCQDDDTDLFFVDPLRKSMLKKDELRKLISSCGWREVSYLDLWVRE